MVHQSTSQDLHMSSPSVRSANKLKTAFDGVGFMTVSPGAAVTVLFLSSISTARLHNCH